MSCSKELGRPLARWKCQAAIDQMPKGRLPSIFTTRQRSPENGWVTVPQRFHDNQGINGCIVHIDLDGHSTKDVFVMVPWDEIREMAQIIMDSCVWQMGSGGFITYGLGKTLQSLTGPVLYDINGREVPRPAWAQQPDGSINAVAVPYDKGAGYNVPAYMTMTIGKPALVPDPELTDYQISLGLMDKLQDEFTTTNSPARQNSLARVLEGLRGLRPSLIDESHRRWWEFPLQPLAPNPSNVQYTCDAKLGNPNVANCEAALYDFLQTGNVVLHPMTGPIIKVSGNCAIAVKANEKHPAPWDMLRGVAENLLAKCKGNGGTAISQPTNQVNIARRVRRAGIEKPGSSEPPFPPTFEIAIYLQPAFSGPADKTCSWEVVSSHQGDSRRCPQSSGPDRPPERILGGNASVGSNDTGIVLSGMSATLSNASMERR